MTTTHVSSYCAVGGCVAVSPDGHGTGVRVHHSDTPPASGLWFSRSEWRAFVLGVADGEFGLDVLDGPAEPQRPTPDPT